jgi:hypothetical protein
LHIPRFAVDLLVTHTGRLDIRARDSRDLRRAGLLIYPQLHAAPLRAFRHSNAVDSSQKAL